MTVSCARRVAARGNNSKRRVEGFLRALHAFFLEREEVGEKKGRFFFYDF